MKKTPNKVHDLSRYAFRKDESFLVDTNVWLYLNPAPSDSSPATSRLSALYSNGLKAMLSAEVSLVMDAIILGEYLNRYCRIEWNALHRSNHKCFKKFRKSEDFKVVGKGAAELGRSMLRLCARRDHPFATTDIEGVLSDFATIAC